MGFDADLVENLKEYTVKIDRTKRYGTILKYSIEQVDTGNYKVFLMKDTASVELALEHGAERYLDETKVLF